jgi:sigma-54 dependent transcriptional regulator, acetoin dehydrogenase operon transcriptional activator AcoR
MNGSVGRTANATAARAVGAPGINAATLTRPVIANSWRRVAMTGLFPSASVDGGNLEEIDRGSRLMTAAAPILNEMATELAGTRYVVMLADRHALLTDLRSGEHSLRSRLEHAGTVEGRRFTEETTGTNSIATAFELRRGIAVRGDEHYIEALKSFSCYGHPIMHPLTQRVEGVLDITCLVEDDSPLLAPFVTRWARHISDRLLTQARATEQHILHSFQRASAKSRRRPVVAVGNDLFLANSAAMQILDSADEAVLRAASCDRDLGEHTQRLRLVSGCSVDVLVEPVSGADAAVFTFCGRDARATAIPVGTVQPRQLGATTLIRGEPGSGRTTTAASLAGSAARWLDATELVGNSESDWLQLCDTLAQQQAVVIEQVDLLSVRLSRRVSALLRTSVAPVIMTCTPPENDDGRIGELLAQCDDDIVLSPLRHRRSDIPYLVTTMLKELGAPHELRFTPAALEALSSHHWPGNLHELRSVVQRVVDHRRVGDVAVADLPDSYRRHPRRRLSPIEEAERDAIVHALRTSRGNKKAAALALGISRTTLYKALRTYAIRELGRPTREPPRHAADPTLN